VVLVLQPCGCDVFLPELPRPPYGCVVVLVLPQQLFCYGVALALPLRPCVFSQALRF
jgi:hypothetical protein